MDEQGMDEQGMDEKGKDEKGKGEVGLRLNSCSVIVVVVGRERGCNMIGSSMNRTVFGQVLCV